MFNNIVFNLLCLLREMLNCFTQLQDQKTIKKQKQHRLDHRTSTLLSSTPFRSTMTSAPSCENRKNAVYKVSRSSGANITQGKFERILHNFRKPRRKAFYCAVPSIV